MMDINRKKPPIIVFVDGISLIPKIGIHTQKIPPITSVNESRVSSAAGIAFDPMEYKIKPIQTKVPCKENKVPLELVDKKGISFVKITIDEIIKQKKPAKATVVNFGVSFLHLKVTEKIEKPIEEIIPKMRPNKDAFSVLPEAIIINPIVAMVIAIQTLIDIFSFKNKKPNNAVKNGIAAKQSKVIAALVFVIEYINVIIAIPSPVPPIIPDIPIFK